jgi:hypothetical protein
MSSTSSNLFWSLQGQWVSSHCVVPGPGASKFYWRRLKPYSSFLHVLGRLGRLVYASTIYVASCAFYATRHDNNYFHNREFPDHHIRVFLSFESEILQLSRL